MPEERTKEQRKKRIWIVKEERMRYKKRKGNTGKTLIMHSFHSFWIRQIFKKSNYINPVLGTDLHQILTCNLYLDILTG